MCTASIRLQANTHQTDADGMDAPKVDGPKSTILQVPLCPGISH